MFGFMERRLWFALKAAAWKGSRRSLGMRIEWQPTKCSEIYLAGGEELGLGWGGVSHSSESCCPVSLPPGRGLRFQGDSSLLGWRGRVGSGK